METKYYIDKSGNFLGGFAGCMVSETYLEDVPAKDQNGDDVLDEDDNPVILHVPASREVFLAPDVPAGAIPVAGPPDHGWQKYDVKNKKWLSLTDEQKKQLGLTE